MSATNIEQIAKTLNGQCFIEIFGNLKSTNSSLINILCYEHIDRNEQTCDLYGVTSIIQFLPSTFFSVACATYKIPLEEKSAKCHYSRLVSDKYISHW